MGIWTGFERGSGGKYAWDSESKAFVKVSEQVDDPNAGLNGPVWFPKDGCGYFDKALNRRFESLSEKKAWMKANGLCQAAPSTDRDRNCPEAGMGKRYYFIPGVTNKPKYYKYR